MKKGFVISFVCIGSILLIGGGVLLGFGIKEAIDKNVQTIKTYDLVEDVYNINLNVSTTNVTFKASSDDSQKVVCYEYEKLYHEVSVKDGELSIKGIDKREWYEKWGFNSGIKVEIYLPLGEYGTFDLAYSTGSVNIPDGYLFDKLNSVGSTGSLHFASSVVEDINITNSTGLVFLEGVSAKSIKATSSTGSVSVSETSVSENIDISASTGSVNLVNVNAKNASLHASTGSVRVSNTVIKEHLKIDTSTGSISLTDSDAETLKLKASTGSIRGVLLSPHIFSVHSKTGNIHVPTSTSGGLCEIETTTGNVSITIKE